MNLIVLGMNDFNVNMNWLSFGGVSIYCHVMIVVSWKLEFLGIDLRLISVIKARKMIWRFSISRYKYEFKNKV